MLAVVVGGVAALLVVGAVIAFCVMRRKNRATAQQRQTAAATPQSDEEAATGRSTAAAAGMGKHPGRACSTVSSLPARADALRPNQQQRVSMPSPAVAASATTGPPFVERGGLVVRL